MFVDPISSNSNNPKHCNKKNTSKSTQNFCNQEKMHIQMQIKISKTYLKPYKNKICWRIVSQDLNLRNLLLFFFFLVNNPLWYYGRQRFIGKSFFGDLKILTRTLTFTNIWQLLPICPLQFGYKSHKLCIFSWFTLYTHAPNIIIYVYYCLPSSQPRKFWFEQLTIGDFRPWLELCIHKFWKRPFKIQKENGNWTIHNLSEQAQQKFVS